MKSIRFDLSSSFGFFQWNKTRGDRRISNLFISKTDVLGILGCILGLQGYEQEKFRERSKQPKQESFYKILGGLNVSIVPLSQPQYMEDHLIHRHMDYINKKGSLMVEQHNLVNPSYRVYIEQGAVEERVYEKLTIYLKNGWSEFIPYFGKNQFPLSIENVEEVVLRTCEVYENITISSLFKSEDVEMEKLPFIIQDDLTEEGEYHYSESLKVFEPVGTSRIESKQTFWSSFEWEPKINYYITDRDERIVFL